MIKTRYHIWRVSLVGVIAFLLSLVMVVRLARLQLSSGQNVGGPSVLNVKTTKYTVNIPAMRGMIFDRYGRPLITNTISYNIVFNYKLWNRDDPNGVLLKLKELCEKYGVSFTDSLPLLPDKPVFTADWANPDNRSSYLIKFITSRGWEEDISAAELFEGLREYYGVPEDLDYATARYLVGVRYEMDKASFSALNDFTFVKNIGIEFVSELGELTRELPGVLTECAYTREYKTKYAAHILGRIGKIYSEEYETLSQQGYAMDDLVGKDGAEKAFESYLRGIDGSTTYAIDSDGRVVSIVDSKEPQAGSNVMLTLDLKLQSATEDALASQIRQMVAAGEENPNSPQDVGGGAAVVIDVRNGDVLAMASYPTYDITKFSEMFDQLNSDKLTPMLNRAIGGIYSPGSVFKMVTAVTGLQQGIILPSSVINCTGIYRQYQDYQPHCWIYDQAGVTHGAETVVTAIRDSCNIFFFDVGRRAGIENLSRCAKLFGLGDYTGIELPGESRGYVACPDSKKALANASWVDGDTLQAAIGQSYNLFTPIQLANYIATLANRGTRYECHLLKYVTSYDFSNIELTTQSVIAGRVEMSDLTYSTVMEGMSEVAENGTASSVFSNYSIHVGGKTGSAQVSKGTANSVFAAFAPFDDPEIAVVVIVEHGGSGNKIAPIARKIFDIYFASDNSLSTENSENTLID